METQGNKSKAMLVHLSTFAQWFFPFGNFIFPLVIWSSTKKDSKFIDDHGRQSINFQLSIFVYTLVLCLIAIPIFLFTIFKHVPFRAMMHDEVYIGNDLTPENISGIVILAIMAAVLFCFLKVAEFFLVIYASVRASEGKEYKYPLCIPFISGSNQPEVPEAEETVAEKETEIQSSGVQSSSNESVEPDENEKA